jgi:sugar phosphate isomerase/epimerase
MAEFRLGCQRITFGSDQRERFPEVFSSVAEAGFAGVEIGFRHIAEIAPDQLLGMLAEHGLVLLGTHLGGNLEDPAQAEGEREILLDVLDYLEAVGGDLIMYSGLRYSNEKQLRNDVEMLNRSAARCRERGVELLYHNHNCEFEGKGRVINALLEQGSEELGFCPDVGWVMKGGEDIVQFLDRAGDRVRALHFKDFASRGEKVDTVCLGTGVAPLEAAAEWALARMEGGWMIAEQDSAEGPAADAVAANGRYLQQLFPPEVRA